MKPFLLLAILLSASTARAAYTTATVTAIDTNLPDGSGGVRVVVTCGGGNSGEKTQPASFTLSSGFSALSDVQTQAWAACDALARTTAIGKLLTVGQVLTRFTPPPPVVTPVQQFLIDLAQWCVTSQAVTAGFVPLKDLDALNMRVLSEYQPAFVNVLGWPRCN